MEIIIIGLISLLLVEVSYLVYSTINRVPTMGRRKVFVDTSALMDGRIVTAATTGFIPDRLVIPTSVVAELQLLADQADSEKRSRARRGLDAIKELQEIEGISVTILNDGPLSEGGVDARLVELAKKEPYGLLCTIDFNLNKVAVVNGIQVLNINELAGSIRMAFLPGETMSLMLTQKGQGDNQAVGYLADGTMVVVDKAGKNVGSTVQIEFIRSLQTTAGRMMFAKVVSGAADTVSKSNPLKKITENLSKPAPKNNGRKVVNEPEQKANTAPTPQHSKPRSKKAPSSRDRENSLIELVNNQ